MARHFLAADLPNPFDGPVYQFKWGRQACSGRHDPAHTITIPWPDTDKTPYIDGWIRDMRHGCPWQLFRNEELIDEGVGPR